MLDKELAKLLVGPLDSYIGYGWDQQEQRFSIYLKREIAEAIVALIQKGEIWN